MSDAGLPDGAEVLEMPEAIDDLTGETGELLIITGGIGDPDEDDEPSFGGEAPAVNSVGKPTSEFTLDELVAEMAGVSAFVADAPAEEAAPAPDRVDELAAAMSDAFADAKPIETETWTRLPFWTIGGLWTLFVGVLTFLLWPDAPAGLQNAPLYEVLVFGGAAMVVGGLAVGLMVWSRARARVDVADRAIVSRVVMLRVLGWTASGVALWVVSMVVLSLRHLDVIR